MANNHLQCCLSNGNYFQVGVKVFDIFIRNVLVNLKDIIKYF